MLRYFFILVLVDYQGEKVTKRKKHVTETFEKHSWAKLICFSKPLADFQ